MDTTPPPPPALPTPENPVPLDVRPIESMPFAGGVKTVVLLRRCDITLAHEIETLGCTGALSAGLTTAEIGELRIGLGGGGVGLPCFVGTDRYCLAHNTVGGLQEGQKVYYPEMVARVSRALTPIEAGKVAFTEAARRTRKEGLHEQVTATGDMLSGYGDLPRGVEIVEEPEEVGPVQTSKPVHVAPFTCPEHTALNWLCRFCVAQAITEGELETSFVVHQPEDESGVQAGEAHFGVSGPEMVEEIKARDAAGAPEIEVYVLVTTFRRKLAR